MMCLKTFVIALKIKFHQQRIDDVRCKDKKGKLLGRKAKKKKKVNFCANTDVLT